jgi:competence protein ComEC
MQPILFFGAVLAFALGVGVQTLIAIPSELILLGLIISLGVGVIWRRNHTQVSAPYLLLCSLLVCSFSAGLLRTEIASWSFGVSELESRVGDTISFTGTVVQEPKTSANTTQLQVSDSTDTLLVSADRYSAAEYGDVVTVTGTLAKPQSFTTELGRTFDYPNYLKAKGVEYTISFADVDRIETGQGNRLLSSLLALKHAFMSQLEQVVPEPQVGLGEGLLLGVKQALGEDIENNFRRTGIIHIVVLSGYNVMLVVTFFMLVFSFFLSPRTRVVAGIIAIISFALLVGLSATVVRASIMAALLLVAQGFGRQYDVMRALFFAGAIMLFLNPYLLIYDIGFQLSFMATLGLLLITPHFESTIVTGAKKLQLKDFFFATLATQIAVLPLLLYHIGEVSIVAIVVNVLVLPVVPVAMLLTFATGMIAFLSLPIASLIGFFANLSLLYILFVAKWFAQLPFAAVAIPEFSAVGMGVLYALLISIFVYLKKRTVKNPTADWTVVVETENPVASSQRKTTGSTAGDTLPKIFR